MMAVRVDERFSITNEDLRKINEADFLPEMTYMDHLRQKVMSFPFFKKSPLQKNSKYQPISRILSLALILLLFLTAKRSQARGNRDTPTAITGPKNFCETLGLYIDSVFRLL